MPNRPAIANVQGDDNAVRTVVHDEPSSELWIRKRSRADDNSHRACRQDRRTGFSRAKAPGNLH